LSHEFTHYSRNNKFGVSFSPKGFIAAWDLAAFLPLKMDTSDTDDHKTKEALLILAAIMALMIGMVILRFGTNILIDCCILNEHERARVDLIRSLCPWYHRRTIPTRDSSNDDEQRIIMHSVEAVPSGIRKERLMNFLPLFHLSVETIKECKLKGHREHSQRMSRQVEEMQREDEEECAESSAVICSICIHELIPGESVFKTPNCHHLFHSNCICDWMSSVTRKNNIECPNCRSGIMTRAALNRILLGERTTQVEDV
jgi:hypothetical protein